MMDGVDPYAYMQQVGSRLDRTDDLRKLDRMPDGLEHLYKVTDPELQNLAESLNAAPARENGGSARRLTARRRAEMVRG